MFAIVFQNLLLFLMGGFLFVLVFGFFLLKMKLPILLCNMGVE